MLAAFESGVKVQLTVDGWHSRHRHAEHGPDSDSVAPIVAQDLVDEAQDVAGVGVAHRMATKAQRVNTSMAVSWHTLPTPLSL